MQPKEIMYKGEAVVIVEQPNAEQIVDAIQALATGLNMQRIVTLHQALYSAGEYYLADVIYQTLPGELQSAVSQVNDN